MMKQRYHGVIASFLNLEASSGEIRVLPLIVGNQREREDILTTYPLLNDKLFLPWNSQPTNVVQALKARLMLSRSEIQKQEGELLGRRDIPLPKVPKTFTQREKDLFLKGSYDSIRDYFKDAVDQLGKAAGGVEADLDEITRYKFVCSFYVQGDIANQCKIWLGGPMSSDSISYSEGQNLNYHSDNSTQGWLNVVEAKDSLALRAAAMLPSPTTNRDQELTSEQAAEYFWLRATQHLGRR